MIEGPKSGLTLLKGILRGKITSLTNLQFLFQWNLWFKGKNKGNPKKGDITYLLATWWQAKTMKPLSCSNYLSRTRWFQKSHLARQLLVFGCTWWVFTRHLTKVELSSFKIYCSQSWWTEKCLNKLSDEDQRHSQSIGGHWSQDGRKGHSSYHAEKLTMIQWALHCNSQHYFHQCMKILIPRLVIMAVSI